MKKNFNFKIVLWFLATAFTVSTPGSTLAMDTVRSTAQWAKTKAVHAKEKTIDRLIEQYKATQELRRKKAAGIATPAELKTLNRRMRKIKIAAAAIGITIATIAIGAVGYKWYSKKESDKRLNIPDKYSDTALHSAAKGGNKNRVQTLIDKNANLDIQDEHGMTALYWATAKGNIEIVQMLIDAGAKPDIINKYGDTALHSAARKGNKEIVQMLINAQANLDIPNKRGNTALHWAAIEGNKEIVQMLINAQADLDIINENGDTALHFAAVFEKPEIVQKLINAQANLDIINKDGETALYFAAHLKKPETAQILKEEIKRRARVEIREALPGLIRAKLPPEIIDEIGQLLGTDKDPKLLEEYKAKSEQFQR